MTTDPAAHYAAHLDTLRARVDRAMEDAGLAHLLVYSGSLHYGFLDDNPYPFKVNPHFKRWVPITDNPQCLVIHTPGEKPKLAFYSPVDFWHKTHPVPEDFWTQHFDITPVAGIADARSLLPTDLARTAIIGEHEALFETWGIGAINPSELLDALHFEFAWKTDYELDCLREANRLGVRAHLAAERAFRNGASEYEIHFAYMNACEHNEHQLPYGNIIALNENTAILHYQYQARRAPETMRSFLIDAGASFNGYHSDITRTYSATDDVFARMIARLEETQLELCAQVRPGIAYADLQTQAHRNAANLLLEFGLATGSADALLESGVTRAFYPHGVGHYLGAQVHDVGGKQADRKGTPIPQPQDQPFLRLTRNIDVNQVFTIEPGLYFIPSLLKELRENAAGKQVNWEGVEAFMPYGGIRIEDNVRVTADGHENFTRDAFRQENGS